MLVSNFSIMNIWSNYLNCGLLVFLGGAVIFILNVMQAIRLIVGLFSASSFRKQNNIMANLKR